MKEYTAVVEQDLETGLYVGYIPGFPGAHSQAETLDELNNNLREVMRMLFEDGEPTLEEKFVGTQRVSLNERVTRNQVLIEELLRSKAAR